MDAKLICLIAGPIISGLVQLFKGVSFVQKYPKLVAAVLSIISGIISGLTFHGLDWQSIAQCVIVPFSMAVATYEVATSTKTSTGA